MVGQQEHVRADLPRIGQREVGRDGAVGECIT
jgi:hypothetical protein